MLCIGKWKLWDYVPIRAGTELCALGIHTESMQQFIGKIQDKGLTEALTERDGEYGDYRTSE